MGKSKKQTAFSSLTIHSHIRINRILPACISLLFFFMPLNIFGEEIVSICNDKDIYVLGKSIDYLKDDSHRLTLDDILLPENQIKFAASDEEIPNFSYESAAVWVKFTLDNLSLSKNWFLELDAYKEVQIFLPAINGGYKKIIGSYEYLDPLIIKKHGYLLIPLHELSETSTIYIRYAHEDTLVLHITLWKEAAYLTQKREDLFYGLYCGVILVMIVYNILLFFILRDKSYIFYAVYVFSMMVVQLIFSGILVDLVFPGAAIPTDKIETFFLGTALIAYLFFMKQFLFTNLLHKNVNRIAAVIMILAALHIPMAFLVPHIIRSISFSIIFVLTLPLNISVIIITLRKKYIPAIFYTIAQFSLLAGISFFIMRNFGFIPNLTIAEYGMPMGSIIEAVLLSLGLAYRVHILQQQKQLAQKWGMENVKIAEKLKKDYQKLFELNPLGIALFDTEGKFLEVNSSYCSMFKRKREDFIGQLYHEINFLPKNQQQEKNRFSDFIKKPRKKVVSFEQPNITGNNKIMVVKYFIDYTRDNEGNITGILACCQNTTRLKKVIRKLKSSINEKDILLKEVHHRVKNNLQIMVSLFRIQSRSFTDPQIISIFESTASRIRTIANIHNRLYLAKNMARIDFTEFIQSIVAQTLSISGPTGSQIETIFEISSDSLPVDIAIPLGLIINELVSNTVKHAFGEVNEPRLFISLQKNRHSNNNPKDEYILIVRDNGIGLSKDFDIENTESFGMTLVENLVDQLNGNLIFKNTPGAEFNISFEYSQNT